jgi:UDP-N-acetylmuramate--alanine ligase
MTDEKISTMLKTSGKHQPKSLGKTQRVHLVGIGGAGMSAIAEVLISQGFQVSGSDKSLSETTERLAGLGAKIFEGHQAENVEDVDVVVYTSAVTVLENEETREAIRRKIPVIKRDEMLGEMMRMKHGICIAGTHGKTTTTTMTGILMNECGLKPTVIIGGVVDYFKGQSAVGQGGSAMVGTGDYIVIEADEYDRTFLQLTPTIAVITTLEAEHLDIYKDLREIKTAFLQFANKVPFFGSVVACLDEPNIQDIIPHLKRKVITYGVSPQADLQAIDVTMKERTSTFTVLFKGEELGGIALNVPGLHNVKNALAAIAVGLELGVPFKKIKKALAAFNGVNRRFQVRVQREDVMLIDDYAHHPTEVQATLEAAKSGWRKRRLVAVFQPHLYSRTLSCYEDFGRVFLLADVLIVTDIFASREKPIGGVTGELVADAAKKFGHKDVHYIPNVKEVAAVVKGLAKPNDMIITLGAGSITGVAKELEKML